MKILKSLAKLCHIMAVRWRTRHLEKTNKTRHELRRQYTLYKGKVVKVMEYIDIVATIMPPMSHHGMPVSHREALRKIYYKYDLPGLKHYIKSINQKIKKVKRKKK